MITHYTPRITDFSYTVPFFIPTQKPVGSLYVSPPEVIDPEDIFPGTAGEFTPPPGSITEETP